MHPKAAEDFAKLYTDLDLWRSTEVAKIKEAHGPGEGRRLALGELLTKETKALQAIQRLKALASKEHSSDKTLRFLEKLAKPQRWQLSSGTAALVETPHTLKAAELLELYRALCDPVTSVHDRLDILDRAEAAVSPHPAPLTSDICDLLDRERDLLARSRPLQSMASLHTRITTLFLQFAEDPRYNQRAADFVQY
jgi:hypothetical protein